MLFTRENSITLDAALRDLHSTDARVRAAAADALGDVPEGADRRRARLGLESVLDDGRFEVRCAAALALGDLGDAGAVDALLARVEDSHPEARQAAVIALGKLGNAQAIPALLAALSAGPPDVRFQAARSLAEIDPAAAFEPLCAALRDADPEVRESAAEALAVVGDRRAAGWLVDLLEDGRPGTRFAAAMTLAWLGDARAFDTLTAFLPDRERAFEAMEGLEAIGDARAALPLAAQMRRFLLPQVLRVRAAAALLVLAPGDAAAPSARALLEKSARSGKLDVRGLAEECLSRLAAARPAQATP
jgi:HEAT repeat protein